MRISALAPVLLCAAALVLSFLCLFAGSKEGFMDDYPILTLNTSRIGASVLNASHSSSNPVISFIDNVTNSVENDINQDLSSLARALGLHDFYNVHLLDFCEGYYTPSPVPNTTLPRRKIHQNVTSCSNRTAMYSFNPRNTLQQELNASGHGDIDLTSNLDWPADVDKGLHALVIAQKATFVLYCVAIALIGVATLLALLGMFSEGRMGAFVNVLVDWLAFLAIGLASAIATAVAVKAVHVVNKYGDHIGARASTGGKFLVLTWVATAVMLVASMVWCFECIVGRKEKRRVSRKGYVDEPRY
ncbi:hypothetical protein B0A55_09918 [Friedmanniomyces simplex]|uniref:MARVEL domain-containing protein n=1 Tax=Friedmanniomyces simplex TaxID=329884 RepID=A0A4U0WRH6_9PEZI|nr:hypothetical protein B0A55_09918 [Friedmanniomyces simplex]